jgi:hypothetical protein
MTGVNTSKILGLTVNNLSLSETLLSGLPTDQDNNLYNIKPLAVKQNFKIDTSPVISITVPLESAHNDARGRDIVWGDLPFNLSQDHLQIADNSNQYFKTSYTFGSNLSTPDKVYSSLYDLSKTENAIAKPEVNFSGNASFEYTLSDGQGGTATATVTIPVLSTANLSIELGTNLAGIADYSSQLPFLDAFNSSRPWITQTKTIWDTKESQLLNLDENGWVKSLPTSGSGITYTMVGTLLLDSLNGRYPGGQYLVLYEGEGTLQYSGDAKKNSSASTPGRDVLNVTPTDAGIRLQITATDPKGTGNYIRNIRVIPASAEATYSSQTFNPDWLNKIQPFQAFRFMDWMNTNNSSQQTWAGRPTPEDSTWMGIGAPVEILVDLANRTHTNPWFNMPHLADNDYITRFAQYVKDHLDPQLKVYVEYSNEVWNSQFSQGKWIEQQGQQQWPNSSNSAFTKRIDWYSQRTTQVINLWEQAFGADKQRVIGVMGAQASNLWTAQRALSFAWSSPSVSAQDLGIDAIAIAPYFGSYLGDPKAATQVQSWTQDADGGLNKLFSELSQGGVLSSGPAGGALQQSYSQIKDYVQLAEQKNLDLLAYEGGQHLVGYNGVENNAAITNLFTQANRDPRMGELYQKYLNTWFGLGGDLFMNFNDVGEPSKWGSWGALEYVGDSSSPKYDALLNLLQSANASAA